MPVENRYVRLEDSEGNKYFFSGKDGSGGGFGNQAVNASVIENNVDAKFYSSGTSIDDPRTTSGKGVIVDYANIEGFHDKKLFKGLYDNVPLGNVAVTIRLLPNFKDNTWFFEENASTYDKIELFYVKIHHYDNKEKRIIPPSSNNLGPIGIVTVSSLKTYPIVPCLGYFGSKDPLKKIYQDHISDFANAANFGEITVVLPYVSSEIVKNSSMMVELVTEDLGQNSYDPIRNNKLLNSIIIDNVSVSKAVGSITSAPYLLM